MWDRVPVEPARGKIPGRMRLCVVVAHAGSCSLCPGGTLLPIDKTPQLMEASIQLYDKDSLTPLAQLILCPEKEGCLSSVLQEEDKNPFLVCKTNDARCPDTDTDSLVLYYILRRVEHSQ
ncbi:hypothetical protein KQX54_020750 [Cotesia glomerata]|uniref:Uncharacterized protein n=1 Tax=Cotesia glomerata TaxID=32391 RepID=A0AAV7IIM7_COTGL|nr:hypothetical protein KQX54_020750 [Cotesia glomerata]